MAAAPLATSLLASRAQAATLVALNPFEVPESRSLFPNASVAGEMRPNSVLFGGYFSDGAPKTLLVWQPTSSSDEILVVTEQVVVPNASGYAQIEIDGLQPGTWYSYGYFQGGSSGFTARSILGTVRTAIDSSSSEPVSIAISACNGGYYDPQNPPSSPFQYSVLERNADEYYDMFIHLGDQAYMDRVFSNGGAKETYLEAWRAYLGSEGMRRSYARAGLYATWDDHEVTDNGSVDPWSTSTSDITRIRNAKEAYFEVMPIVPGPDLRLWRSYQWGRTAEIIILDSRYERDRPSTDEYLSREQMDFLKDRLSTSPCHFKIVANSVPITDLPFLFDIFNSNDRWEGYRDQRTELLNHINNESIENVWFLTGDQHVNFVSRINRSGSDLASRSREIGVTGGNSGLGFSGSNFSYSQTSPRACILTFDPGANSVNTRFIASNGSVDFDQDLTQ